MSNMSRFNYECQELAENNTSISTNALKVLVKEQFADRPVYIPHALVVTLGHAQRIQLEMVSGE